MKRPLLILLLCLTALTGRVQAQDAPRLATLDVSLWPEFDRPEALIIYRGMFAEDVALPVPVEIRIPASAGEPTAVAYVDETGQRFNQPHTITQEGDWIIVSFDLESRAFQLEYYDAMTSGEEGQKTYTLNLLADYAIADLSLDFQVPPTAQDFTLDPAADSVTQETDGLTYHIVHHGPVEPGEALSWTIAYQKDDENLTVSLFTQPQTPTPAPAVMPPAPSGTVQSGPADWVWVAALVALLAVGAGAFLLVRLTSASSAPPPRKKRRGSGRGAAPPPRADEVRYCHRCGAKLRPDATFCHQCGAAVRISS